MHSRTISYKLYDVTVRVNVDKTGKNLLTNLRESRKSVLNGISVSIFLLLLLCDYCVLTVLKCRFAFNPIIQKSSNCNRDMGIIFITIDMEPTLPDVFYVILTVETDWSVYQSSSNVLPLICHGTASMPYGI